MWLVLQMCDVFRDGRITSGSKWARDYVVIWPMMMMMMMMNFDCKAFDNDASFSALSLELYNMIPKI